MPDIRWGAPFCGEGSACFRVGTDSAGHAYIAVAGAENVYLTGTHEALRALIRDIKAGKADHLLQAPGPPGDARKPTGRGRRGAARRKVVAR
ncbi:hypothetical protein GCM10010214_28000 [Streptomyces abikoensis]|nr:hypothetical protein GCM10010214_28000 [Streptomyces abikoensis]